MFAASGKTPGGHALSTAAGQDCSLLRAVVLEDICRDYEATPEAAAALASMPADEEYLMTTSDGRIIRVAANPIAKPGPEQQTAGNRRITWTAPESAAGS